MRHSWALSVLTTPSSTDDGCLVCSLKVCPHSYFQWVLMRDSPWCILMCVISVHTIGSYNEIDQPICIHLSIDCCAKLEGSYINMYSKYQPDQEMLHINTHYCNSTWCGQDPCAMLRIIIWMFVQVGTHLKISAYFWCAGTKDLWGCHKRKLCVIHLSHLPQLSLQTNVLM